MLTITSPRGGPPLAVFLITYYLFKMSKYSQITKFFYETGALNYVKNSGWSLIKNSNPSTVSMHLYRSAIICFITSNLENIENPYKLTTIILFSKIYKARLGDFQKVTSNYIQISNELKEEVKKNQFNLLDEDTKLKIQNDFKELTNKEKLIIEDSFQLEMALESKELIEIGFIKAEEWLKRINKVIRTSSAKILFSQIIKTEPSSWWQDLKLPPRVELKDYINHV